MLESTRIPESPIVVEAGDLTGCAALTMRRPPPVPLGVLLLDPPPKGIRSTEDASLLGVVMVVVMVIPDPAVLSGCSRELGSFPMMILVMAVLVVL